MRDEQIIDHMLSSAGLVLPAPHSYLLNPLREIRLDYERQRFGGPGVLILKLSFAYPVINDSTQIQHIFGQGTSAYTRFFRGDLQHVRDSIIRSFMTSYVKYATQQLFGEICERLDVPDDSCYLDVYQIISDKAASLRSDMVPIRESHISREQTIKSNNELYFDHLIRRVDQYLETHNTGREFADIFSGISQYVTEKLHSDILVPGRIITQLERYIENTYRYLEQERSRVLFGTPRSELIIDSAHPIIRNEGDNRVGDMFDPMESPVETITRRMTDYWQRCIDHQQRQQALRDMVATGMATVRQEPSSISLESLNAAMQALGDNAPVDYNATLRNMLRNVLPISMDPAEDLDSPFIPNPNQITKDAEKVALELLCDNLNDVQRESFKTHGFFDVIGGTTGRSYRIVSDRQMNVYYLDERGVPHGRCFVPKQNLPLGDILLSQMLSLQLDEEAAIAVSNPFGVSFHHDRKYFSGHTFTNPDRIITNTDRTWRHRSWLSRLANLSIG